MPHPVRAIGIAITTGERVLLRPSTPEIEFLRGAVLTGTVVGASWIAARLAIRKRRVVSEVLLAWTTIAARNLIEEATAVVAAVEDGNLMRARKRLARIVGRDTDALDEQEILRAVIETVAEGLCDGIVAPIVYLALGGVPLAMAYKAANTLDSMIGHREPPYLYFGRAAARLDDVVNFVPARIAALAIAGAAAVVGADARRSREVWWRDGGKHPSPNAGQCEAAMAGALGVRLGGMNYYDGRPSPKPLLGAEGRRVTRRDARRALRIAGAASLMVCSAAWLFLRWRERKS
jgi:adenosylcobinamide-phosphate synthase